MALSFIEILSEAYFTWASSICTDWLSAVKKSVSLYTTAMDCLLQRKG